MDKYKTIREAIAARNYEALPWLVQDLEKLHNEQLSYNRYLAFVLGVLTAALGLLTR